MKISDWLDERKAENVDVSQIVLQTDMPYDEVPDETIFFSKRLIQAGFSVKAIIPILKSNDMDTGITAKVKTRKQVCIHKK